MNAAALAMEMGWGAVKPPAHWPLRPIGSHWSVDGLISHWGMREGQGLNVCDASGQGNHGTFQGLTATAWVAGGGGWATEYLDNDDEVSVGTGVMDFHGSTPFTCIARIQTTLDGRNNYCIGTHISTGWYMRSEQTVADALLVKIDDGVDDAYGTGTTPLNDGNWHTIAITIDGSTLLGYTDGVEEINEAYVNVGDMDNDLALGNLGGIAMGAQSWEGLIDYTAIYNRALSAEEIAWLAKYPSTPYLPPVDPWVLASVAGGTTYYKALSDGIGLADDFVKAPGRPITDGVGLADAIQRLTGRSLADSIVVTDAVGKAIARALSGDAVGLADAMTKTPQRPVADGVGLADAVTKTPQRPVADSVGLADDLDAIRVIQKLLSDALAVDDSLTRKALVSLADELGLSDVLTRRIGLSFTDLVSLSDSLATSLGVELPYLRLAVALAVEILAATTDPEKLNATLDHEALNARRA